MTRLFYLIRHEEGGDRPGTLPFRRNNPCDLRHSPHSSHEGIGPDDIGIIPTMELGEADCERQLQLMAARTIYVDPKTKEDIAPRKMTLGDCIFTFAPPNENNSALYLKHICDGLQLPPSTPLSEVLKIQYE